MTIKACLKSMRLRTLPLSLAGSVMGVFIARSITGEFGPAAWAVLLTTALLQILSNLSNELGDTLNGTDRADREGIHYSLQDGDMTVPQMKRLITFTAIACMLSGTAMIWIAMGSLLRWESIILLILGAAAIWAAMRYTLGKNPYGYRGLGDLFVFIFFGLVSTCGACFVCAPDLGLPSVLASSILPACAIGFFSIGVLNVNNIRDAVTDAENRVTVAIKLGGRGARIYQTVLIASAWLLMIIFAASGPLEWKRWLFVLTLPLYIIHLKGVWTREGRALDPMLPLLVISTFLLSLLTGIGIQG